jgi:hypothetical protein
MLVGRIIFAIALVVLPPRLLLKVLLAGHFTALGTGRDIVGANTEAPAQLILA